MSRTGLHIAIVRNNPTPSSADEHWVWRSASGGRIQQEGFQDASEYGVVEEVELIESFLKGAGHTTTTATVDNAAQLLRFLQDERPDVIFNCCESVEGKAAGEMHVTGVYELAGIPYTGSPPLTLGIALNKGIAKTLFRAHGVPTADFVICDDPSDLSATRALKRPVIVKPVAEDASIGIDEGAIVRDEAALARRIQFVLDEFHQAAIVEEFIEGREFNVAMLALNSPELIALPISEILFGDMPGGGERIVSYEAKWIPSSQAYHATVPQCPAEIDSKLAESIRSIAVKAARAIGLRDYGRIDLRVRSSDNAVFVLEANPNPDISKESGMVTAAGAIGRTHADLILEILERAIERSRQSGGKA